MFLRFLFFCVIFKTNPFDAAFGKTWMWQTFQWGVRGPLRTEPSLKILQAGYSPYSANLANSPFDWAIA